MILSGISIAQLMNSMPCQPTAQRNQKTNQQRHAVFHFSSGCSFSSWHIAIISFLHDSFTYPFNSSESQTVPLRTMCDTKFSTNLSACDMHQRAGTSNPAVHNEILREKIAKTLHLYIGIVSAYEPFCADPSCCPGPTQPGNLKPPALCFHQSSSEQLHLSLIWVLDTIRVQIQSPNCAHHSHLVKAVQRQTTHPLWIGDIYSHSPSHHLHHFMKHFLKTRRVIP